MDKKEIIQTNQTHKQPNNQQNIDNNEEQTQLMGGHSRTKRKRKEYCNIRYCTNCHDDVIKKTKEEIKAIMDYLKQNPHKRKEKICNKGCLYCNKKKDRLNAYIYIYRKKKLYKKHRNESRDTPIKTTITRSNNNSQLYYRVQQKSSEQRMW